MHVLVVGGTGFIGRCVVRQLVDAGCDVTVVHRGRTQAPLPPAVAEVLADRDQLAGVLASLPRPGEWSYEYDKLLVERAVLASAEPAGTVLRLPMVYGPFDRQRRLQPYLQRMEARRPAILLEAGQSAWRVSRGFVEDVAAAVA